MKRWMAIGSALAIACGAHAADYVVIRHTAAVPGAPDTVWARIGDYCGITKLLDVTCTYASGSGDVGTVRALNGGATLEPMIARTSRSYTYGQIAGGMKDFDYHGTLAVEPAGGGHSTIVYTIVYDQARMPSDEIRAAQRTRIEARFQSAVDKARELAETR